MVWYYQPELRCQVYEKQFRNQRACHPPSCAAEQARIRDSVKAKRSDLRNGLTRRQRTFILEKLVGLNDKDAALSAGYSLSVSENTKQRIWKPRARVERERLRRDLAGGTSAGPNRQ